MKEMWPAIEIMAAKIFSVKVIIWRLKAGVGGYGGHGWLTGSIASASWRFSVMALSV
jgi:hypothetical protein